MGGIILLILCGTLLVCEYSPLYRHCSSMLFLTLYVFLCLLQHFKTTPMNTRIAKKLVSELPLNMNDLARLVLEMTEALGGRATGLSRLDLLALLRRVIGEGVLAVEKSEQTVSFGEAAHASLAARQDRRPSTRRDLRHFIRRMLRNSDAARRPLRAWTVADCKRLLTETFPDSPSSYRKGRSILNSIFMYGLRQEWCDKNPVQGVEVPRIVEQPIQVLTMEEVKRLEKATELPEHRDMALSLRLMLYCGVRPAEVVRINPQRDIVEDKLIIRPQCSKTGGGRVIPLRKVKQFLGSNPKQCHIPRNWQNRWLALRRAAHIHRWRADACRHTFATYHAQFYKNLPALQAEMGHRNLNLLRTRYIMAGCEEGKFFWK